MKYTLLFTLLLTACGPYSFKSIFGIRKFQIGDCAIISLDEPEEWEKRNIFNKYKVIEVGKNGYLLKSLRYGFETTVSFEHLWEDFYQKVPCENL